ncbi:MAG: hypothetical protein IPK94_05275 [Saprospiraceae bacterium]|nr:hypothetical protein [Saprospiraceae bacterium]
MPLQILFHEGPNAVGVASPACDTFDFGETEDYKIILQEAILIDPCQNGIQDA